MKLKSRIEIRNLFEFVAKHFRFQKCVTCKSKFNSFERSITDYMTTPVVQDCPIIPYALLFNGFSVLLTTR